MFKSSQVRTLVVCLLASVALSAGCSGAGKEKGAEVANALCADAEPISATVKIKDNAEVHGRDATEQEIKEVCASFLSSMAASNVKKVRAISTLGRGGKKIWLETVFPTMQKKCPGTAGAEDVGALTALLLACKPLGAW